MQARRRRKVVLQALGLLMSLTAGLPAQAAPGDLQAAAATRVSAPSAAAASARTTAPLASVGTLKPPSPEERKLLLKDAIAQLQSADPALLSQAIANLRGLAGRDAALALMERLRKGLPPQLAEIAVEALGSMNQPSVTPVLVELTLHRRWQIREKAVVALGALKMRTAVSALLYALDDPSPEVRSAAASVLGRLGDPRALPALASAMEHGVNGAMLALAQLGNARHAELILKFATRDLQASEPALRTLLTRPNLHISSKLAVVNTVRSLQQPEAQALIASWRSALGKGIDPQLLAALSAQGKKP
jgi:HEAT repeat protein